jgi:hypothetical protein
LLYYNQPPSKLYRTFFISACYWWLWYFLIIVFINLWTRATRKILFFTSKIKVCLSEDLSLKCVQKVSCKKQSFHMIYNSIFAGIIKFLTSCSVHFVWYYLISKVFICSRCKLGTILKNNLKKKLFFLWINTYIFSYS